MANKWLTSVALVVGMAAIPTVASAETQLRVFGGVSDVQDFEGSYDYYGYTYDAELTADSGYVVGAAYGAVYGNWVLEAELSYREVEFDQVSFSTTFYGDFTYDIDGDISAYALLANAWYNLPVGQNFGVYAGGGLGFANAQVEIEGSSDSALEFAWQLGAGATFRTESGLGFGVGYRYFNTSDIGATGLDVESHDVIAEITRRF